MELAQKLRLDPNSIGPILNSRKTTRTPGAMINVMVTDDMVASFKSESSYKVINLLKTALESYFSYFIDFLQRK